VRGRLGEWLAEVKPTRLTNPDTGPAQRLKPDPTILRELPVVI
jgi:hypothetical protein